MKTTALASSAQPSGSLAIQRQRPQRELTLADIHKWAKPQKGLSEQVNDWRSDNWRENVRQRGYPDVALSKKLHIPTQYGALFVARVVDGEIEEDLGLASLRVITDTGVASIVNSFLNTFELENYKYHGIGTGSGGELAANTALGTELTTQLNPDSVRATGTQVAFASNIYQTVATNNVDSAVAIAEHGIFSQAAVAAASGVNVLLDRSQFAAVNLASGDGIQTDYRLTFAAGG